MTRHLRTVGDSRTRRLRSSLTPMTPRTPRTRYKTWQVWLNVPCCRPPPQRQGWPRSTAKSFPSLRPSPRNMQASCPVTGVRPLPIDFLNISSRLPRYRVLSVSGYSHDSRSLRLDTRSRAATVSIHSFASFVSPVLRCYMTMRILPNAAVCGARVGSSRGAPPPPPPQLQAAVRRLADASIGRCCDHAGSKIIGDVIELIVGTWAGRGEDVCDALFLIYLRRACHGIFPGRSPHIYVSRRAYVFHIAGQERMSIVPRGSCFRNQTSGLMFRKHESNPADALQTTWQTSQLSLLLSPAHLRAVHLLPAPASLFSDSYGISLLVGLQASQVRSPAPPPSSVAHPQAVSSSCYLLCLCKSVHVSWILPHGVRP